MAAAAILEKFQMAISPQPVVRSTPCLVLGGFSATADLMAQFSGGTNPTLRPPPSWKNFKWPYLRNRSHISATGRPIHSMFGSMVGFSGRRI